MSCPCCKRCNEPLVIVDGYMVCPGGHGRLVLDANVERYARDEPSMTIKVRSVRDFRPL